MQVLPGLMGHGLILGMVLLAGAPAAFALDRNASTSHGDVDIPLVRVGEGDLGSVVGCSDLFQCHCPATQCLSVVNAPTCRSALLRPGIMSHQSKLSYLIVMTPRWATRATSLARVTGNVVYECHKERTCLPVQMTL